MKKRIKTCIKVFNYFFIVISTILFAQKEAMAQNTPNKTPPSDTDIHIPPIPEHPFVPGIILPPPQIIVKGDYKPIVPQKIAVDIEVISNIATTTYDITYYNPNQATLEGEFVLPLTEMQNVSALALDINGKMRDGVVVEKEKGRQTFEAVVRNNVDPALAEKIEGNQFKLRIYPFSPKGTRRVKVTLEENLISSGDNYVYSLPLNYKQELDEFSIKATILNSDTAPTNVSTNIENFSFTKQEGSYSAQFSAKEFNLDKNLSFAIPFAKSEKIFTHTEDNTTYFYSDLKLKQNSKEKKLPSKIALYWDASYSGTKRNLKSEIELLKAYIEKIKDVQITLIAFNVKEVSKKEFTITNGDSTPLINEIEKINYDGATRFDMINSNSVDADEILVFTDGVASLGDTRIESSKTPIYAITSSNAFERGMLVDVAQKSLGSFINLSSLTLDEALTKLTTQPLRIVEYSSKDNVQEIYPSIGTDVLGNISLAGFTTSSSAKLNIKIGYNKDEIIEEININIAGRGENPAVERLWAKLKIKDLELNAKANNEEIKKLGQTYSIVTDETSLIVLENVRDYVRYEITPPDDLLDEYNRIKGSETNKVVKDETTAINEAINYAKNIKDWYGTEFSKEKPKKKKFEKLRAEGMVDGAVAREATGAVAPSRSYNSSGTMPYYDDRRVEYNDARLSDASETLLNMVFGDREESRSAPSANRVGASEESKAPDNMAKAIPQNKASIKIKAWNPDTPYLKILEKSSNDEIYKDYLKIRDGYADQPSFFFDVANEFKKRNLNDEALIILSNIVEMELENIELLRIGAQKLLEFNYPEYAIEIFKKIVELRSSEPQPYRDLALTYQELNQPEKALENFYKIITTNWDRFSEIKQTVLVEMNNLIAKNPKLDINAINKELIFKVPVDIRITLSWSSDNTDIDLHVVDPYEENCFYGNKLTQIGGRYSYDFTDGFGPEEFMLKEAIKGRYKIKVNNFADRRQSISGPSTLYLDIFTHYGSKNEEHQRILVRAGDVKDDNVIGDVEFE